MSSYAAFLGHQPHLSLAELSASIADFKVQKILGRTVVIFESNQELTMERLGMLGGTVVIAKQLDANNPTLESLPQILWEQVMSVKGKATFGLRTNGVDPGKIRNLYRMCKDELKRHGKPSRYVGNENNPAASVLLLDEGLVDGSGGCELCILAAKDFFWLGKTVAAQDVDAYTKRDMKKPVRDTTTGLLPPKLAQILLNFGVWLTKQSQRDADPTSLTVFDPFCGTGVVPMECLLRGFSVLASDKSERAVKGCTKNLEWLRKEEDITKKDVPSTVWKQDATKPFVMKEHVDVIVTETSLGPALEKRPAVRESTTLRKENEELQEAFLRNAVASLPGTSIVCIWPVWYVRGEPVVLEKPWKVIGELGLQATLPPGIEPDLPGRLSLIYRRPDQFVGREILLLRARRSS